MIHKVIVIHRDINYPFKPYWACVCGIRMKSTIMGYGLYREFAEHLKETR